MWKTERPLNATVTPRPARIAYLIPETCEHAILDSIFRDCFARWCGRRTPVIPTDGVSISDTYWHLLDIWDADIIYSYTELSAELQDRLYHYFAPSELVLHQDLVGGNAFCPRYKNNFEFLSSLSYLPIYEKRAQLVDGFLPEVVDNEIWDQPIDDFSDSFGFPSQCFPSHSFIPHARRISVRKPGYAHRGWDRETNYHSDIGEWIKAISEKPSITTLSRLSDIDSPIIEELSNYKNSWDDHLTIVVGDSIGDRLLMWNSQHRYSPLNTFSEIPCIRLSESRFVHGEMEWIKNWITMRNDRCFQNNNQKQVVLKSHSLSKDKLDEYAQLLQPSYVRITTQQCLNCEVFAPLTSAIRSDAKLSLNRKAIKFRFNDNTLELPTCPPTHIANSVASHLCRGLWASELLIERAENHSQSTNLQHLWNFPRRLRIETSCKISNYVKELDRIYGEVIPPPLRPSKTGKLVLWDSYNWSRPIIEMPTDYSAFVKNIRDIPSQSPQIKRLRRELQKKGKPLIHRSRFDTVQISDKGRDLLGVMQFFRSLPETLHFLNNDFWLEIIAKLTKPLPQNKNERVKQISKQIELLLKSSKIEEIDCNSVAKDALAIAARSLESQKVKSITFERLLAIAKSVVDIETQKQSDVREELETSVQHLRNIGFLSQGFHWKCQTCDHENWVNLEQICNVLECEICRNLQSTPASGGFTL